MPACRVCERNHDMDVYEQVGYNRGTNKTRPRRDWNPNEAADDLPSTKGKPLMDTIVSDPHHCQYCHPQFVTEYPSAFPMGGGI